MRPPPPKGFVYANCVCTILPRLSQGLDPDEMLASLVSEWRAKEGYFQETYLETEAHFKVGFETMVAEHE